MRFYTKPHQFYCGIDLHARLLAVCIVDQGGAIVLQKQLPAQKQLLLDVLAPYRATTPKAGAAQSAALSQPRAARSSWTA